MKGMAMSRFRAAVTAALIVSTGFATAGIAPAQAAGPCCIVRGERWFTGPTQAADCVAVGQALLSSWDGYRCTPVGDRTHLTYWRIIS
jgi:hypothetical protein